MEYFICKDMGKVFVDNLKSIAYNVDVFSNIVRGEIEDLILLYDFRNANPAVVNEDVFKGVAYLSVSQVTDSETGELRDLNDTELSQKNEAKKFLINRQLKEKVRWYIEQKVGDTLDQLANTDKQLKMILPVNARIYLLVLHLFNQLNIYIPESILPADKKQAYDTYINNYLGAIDLGMYVDRIDVDDNISQTIEKGMVDDVTLANLLKTYYLDKKL